MMYQDTSAIKNLDGITQGVRDLWGFQV